MLALLISNWNLLNFVSSVEFLQCDCRKRMEPLVTNRRLFIWLCICPDNSTSPSRCQKLAHRIFAVAVLITLLWIFGACFACCWNIVSIDLGRSMFAFMYAASALTVIYLALIGIFLLHHKIGSIFDDLSDIYKASKCFLNQKAQFYSIYYWRIFLFPVNFLSNLDENLESFPLLARANNISEWMWKMYFKVTAFALIMNFAVAPPMFILFNWLTHQDLNVENFYHPIPYVYVTRLCHFMSQIKFCVFCCCFKNQFTVESNNIYRIHWWIGFVNCGWHWLFDC